MVTIMDELTARWADLVGRIHGPLSFRLILQPAVAIFLAIQAGMHDAKEGRPPVLLDDSHRSGRPPSALTRRLESGGEGVLCRHRDGRRLSARRTSMGVSRRGPVRSVSSRMCPVSAGSWARQPYCAWWKACAEDLTQMSTLTASPPDTATRLAVDRTRLGTSGR